MDTEPTATDASIREFRTGKLFARVLANSLGIAGIEVRQMVPAISQDTQPWVMFGTTNSAGMK